MNLTSMSRKELMKLRDDIDKELVAAEERERRDALKAAEEAVAKFGFSLGELGVSGNKRGTARDRRAKSSPKYRNPADPKQTWTGMGRKPQWIHEAIANGTDLSTLEI
ncbi:H-NS histone family protein [Seohaeicola zhoushanensis]|uniref:Nucleoid-structuring protein H-NS n=1 Tax=Seohaeicola zhoushanensis TaxID=1569283 RepID=A0A8J3H1N3_9RHOB|nr:H-NS histone family protein [Seohaeicola zhoushanensis]GHF64147.1 nucleoid-structuring protein H-NS [Seohaeicola zhoushanensis]